MSGAVFDTLLRAGAPDLPSEHFYRVKYRRSLGWDIVEVEIRERVWWKWLSMYRPWSRFVGTGTLKSDPDTANAKSAEELVAQVCRLAMRNAELDTVAAKRQRRLDGLVGRHGYRL